ncbi:MAG TPA: hypothetical protein VGH38_12835 [Bryobacteraceae bacterium]
MTDQITDNAPLQEKTEQAPKEEATEQTPKRKVSCEGCSLWGQVKEKVRITKLLETAISKLDERLNAPEFKPSVGDYLKLIQLEKEFEHEQVKEIKVTWVKTEPSNEQ